MPNRRTTGVVPTSIQSYERMCKNYHELKIVSTDPPYYDNIGYADLSDFFYVWLRRSLKSCIPGIVRYSCRTQSGRAGRHALPPRQQGGRGDLFFPQWHDPSDALTVGAGAPWPPAHHLLRLQAIRTKGRHRSCEHRLGDVSGRRDPIRLRRHWYLAHANRDVQPNDRHGFQRPRLQHHPRLPPPSG